MDRQEVSRIGKGSGLGSQEQLAAISMLAYYFKIYGIGSKQDKELAYYFQYTVFEASRTRMMRNRRDYNSCWMDVALQVWSKLYWYLVGPSRASRAYGQYFQCLGRSSSDFPLPAQRGSSNLVYD